MNDYTVMGNSLMKRILLKTLLFVVAVSMGIACLFLFACGKEVKLTSVAVEIKEQYKETNGEYGIGNFDYSLYNVVLTYSNGEVSVRDLREEDVNEIERLKLWKADEHEIKVEVEGFNTSFTCTGMRNEFKNVELNGIDAVYTGKPFKLSVSGHYPEGTKIEYLNGNEFTDVCDLDVKAILTYEGYATKIISGHVRITQKEYDMSKFTLEDVETTYDGERHAIEGKGELPEGVSVSYYISKVAYVDGKRVLQEQMEGNSAIDKGEYVVEARFSYSNANYKRINSKTATLNIRGMFISLSAFEEDLLNQSRETFVYDGKDKFLDFSDNLVVPEKVDTSDLRKTYYRVYEDGTYEIVSEVKNAGTYALKVSGFKIVEQYRQFYELEKEEIFAVYEVSPCLLEVVVKPDIDPFVYDGEEHAFIPDMSKMPDDSQILVAFEKIEKDGLPVNAVKEAGEYKVSLRVIGDGNYQPMQSVIETTATLLPYEFITDGRLTVAIPYDYGTHEKPFVIKAIDDTLNEIEKENLEFSLYFEKTQIWPDGTFILAPEEEFTILVKFAVKDGNKNIILVGDDEGFYTYRIIMTMATLSFDSLRENLKMSLAMMDKTYDGTEKELDFIKPISDLPVELDMSEVTKEYYRILEDGTSQKVNKVINAGKYMVKFTGFKVYDSVKAHFELEANELCYEYEIVAKPIDITLRINSNTTYNGTSQQADAYLEGVPEDSGISISSLKYVKDNVEYTSVVEVGEYTVSCILTDSPNYKVTCNTVKFNVLPYEFSVENRKNILVIYKAEGTSKADVVERIETTLTELEKENVSIELYLNGNVWETGTLYKDSTDFEVGVVYASKDTKNFTLKEQGTITYKVKVVTTAKTYFPNEVLEQIKSKTYSMIYQEPIAALAENVCTSTWSDFGCHATYSSYKWYLNGEELDISNYGKDNLDENYLDTGAYEVELYDFETDEYYVDVLRVNANIKRRRTQIQLPTELEEEFKKHNNVFLRYQDGESMRARFIEKLGATITNVIGDEFDPNYTYCTKTVNGIEYLVGIELLKKVNPDSGYDTPVSFFELEKGTYRLYYHFWTKNYEYVFGVGGWFEVGDQKELPTEEMNKLNKSFEFSPYDFGTVMKEQITPILNELTEKYGIQFTNRAFYTASGTLVKESIFIQEGVIYSGSWKMKYEIIDSPEYRVNTDLYKGFSLEVSA